MSKGLSWRQHSILKSIARLLERDNKGDRSIPIPWRIVDYGPTNEDDYFSPRVQWNLEQSIRRSLRSLEHRGLVELGRYCFRPFAEMSEGLLGSLHQAEIVWTHIHPDEHVPGEGRIMTGVILTDAGWDWLAVERDQQ
jgi:hypothetical protein